MQYILSFTIISFCLLVISWGLRVYKENRKLEKQLRKFHDEEY